MSFISVLGDSYARENNLLSLGQKRGLPQSLEVIFCGP
jgi:hypothetical protein